jgi:hypothetical protein
MLISLGEGFLLVTTRYVVSDEGRATVKLFVCYSFFWGGPHFWKSVIENRYLPDEQKLENIHQYQEKI